MACSMIVLAKRTNDNRVQVENAVSKIHRILIYILTRVTLVEFSYLFRYYYAIVIKEVIDDN